MAAKMERTSTPGIFKRGSRYIVVWRHRGKQHKDSFRTLAEAREAKGRAQAGERRAYSRLTFDEYATDWLGSYQGRTAYGIADSTRAGYKRSIEQWAIPHFRRMKMGDIGPRDVRDFVAWMQEKGVRPPSIRKNLVPLKALFATAFEDGDIKANPTLGVRLRLPSEGDRKAKAMTGEELGLVLAALPDEWRPFFTFLGHTGLRISEALAVTWDDLELGTTKPHVQVRRQLYRGELKRLKSRHSERDVPLTTGMVATLLARRASDYAGPGSPVFSSPTGKALDAHNMRTRVLRPATKALGLEWVGFHTFRHTCASLLFVNGKNAKQVQMWLGHGDPGFTLRTYVHLMDDGLGDAEFLDSAVSAARPTVPDVSPVSR